MTCSPTEIYLNMESEYELNEKSADRTNMQEKKYFWSRVDMLKFEYNSKAKTRKITNQSCNNKLINQLINGKKMN